jgi:hypothetical protein
MIGILAYGSLIADPGWEIQDYTVSTIRDVETPFSVEYARQSSTTRAGAPTLVPVADEKGWQVPAWIYVLKPGTRMKRAQNILYRRELHRTGDPDKKYRRPDRPGVNTIIAGEVQNLRGIDRVLYTRIEANLQDILNERYSELEKAQLLARLAIDSVTETTYFACQDGIHYLDVALHYGVQTKLTDAYGQAILQMADNALDLAEARLRIARQKGIIP